MRADLSKSKMKHYEERRKIFTLQSAVLKQYLEMGTLTSALRNEINNTLSLRALKNMLSKARKKRRDLVRGLSGEKYGSKRTQCRRQHSHRSRLESAVCDMLAEDDPTFELEQVEDHVYLSEGRVLYVADFRLRNKKTGEVFWREAKGKETQRWPSIKRLWKAYGPGRLEIWKGTYCAPRLEQTIVPRKAEA